MMSVSIRAIAIILRIISGLSIIIYLFFLFFFFCKIKALTMSNKYNIQFCLSNLIYSISMVIPDIRDIPILCKCQSSITLFAELNTIAIGTYIVIIAQLNFVNINILDKEKTKVYIVSIITSWIFPFIYAFIAYFFSGSTSISEFCWLSEPYFIFSYIGIRMIYFIVFFYYLYKLIRELKVYHCKINLGEIYNEYISRIKCCAIGMVMLMIIFILYSIQNFLLDYKEGDKETSNFLYIFTVIADVLSHPIVVLLFVLTKDNINTICCKKGKEEPIMNISLMFHREDREED